MTLQPRDLEAKMLFILADVYRIATLRRPEPPQHDRGCDQAAPLRRSWYWIAGLRF